MILCVCVYNVTVYIYCKRLSISVAKHLYTCAECISESLGESEMVNGCTLLLLWIYVKCKPHIFFRLCLIKLWILLYKKHCKNYL